MPTRMPLCKLNIFTMAYVSLLLLQALASRAYSDQSLVAVRNNILHARGQQDARPFIARRLATVSSASNALVNSTNAASMVACPLTGKMPQKTAHPFTRCLRANEFSCCESCADTLTGLQLIYANLTLLLLSINPALVDTYGDKIGGFKLCGFIQGSEACLQQLEQLACGVHCDPDSGKYVEKSPGGAYVVRVCKDAADYVFNQCKDSHVTGLVSDVTSVVPDGKSMLNYVYGSFIRQAGLPAMTFTVIDDGSDNCYDIPAASETPRQDLCCDPMVPIPEYCPANIREQVEGPEFSTHANSTKDILTCGNSIPPPPAAASLTSVADSTSPPPPSKAATLSSSPSWLWSSLLRSGLWALAAAALSSFL